MKTPMRELIRTWRAEGFQLAMWDTGRTDRRGQTRIEYKLWHRGMLVFEGDDFCCSPLHADDSDASVGALLGFLSLRPEDTDREYFDDYSDEQLEFADLYGEELAMFAMELEEGRES